TLNEKGKLIASPSEKLRRPCFHNVVKSWKIIRRTQEGELFITRIYGARAPSACCLWYRIIRHVDHCHRIPTRPRTVDRLEDTPGLRRRFYASVLFLQGKSDQKGRHTRAHVGGENFPL